jgi:hypothetical protein
MVWLPVLFIYNIYNLKNSVQYIIVLSVETPRKFITATLASVETPRKFITATLASLQ